MCVIVRTEVFIRIKMIQSTACLIFIHQHIFHSSSNVIIVQNMSEIYLQLKRIKWNKSSNSSMYLSQTIFLFLPDFEKYCFFQLTFITVKINIFVNETRRLDIKRTEIPQIKIKFANNYLYYVNKRLFLIV